MQTTAPDPLLFLLRCQPNFCSELLTILSPLKEKFVNHFFKRVFVLTKTFEHRFRQLYKRVSNHIKRVFSKSKFSVKRGKVVFGWIFGFWAI